MNESKTGHWIVRFGGTPVRIIERYSGLVYSLSHQDSASRFLSLAAAQEAAAVLPIMPGKIITIEMVPGELVGV